MKTCGSAAERSGARGWAVRLAVTAMGVLLGACAPAVRQRAQPAVPPVTAPVGAALPPVPPVDGALRLDLVYPAEGATLAASDSTFVFGSTGSGRTQLTINGAAVPVAANGAFLAYLPVPADGMYRLQATRDAEATRLDRNVRVPTPAPSVGGAQIVPGSVYPTGSIALPRGEPIEVGLRGSPGGVAALLLPGGERIPLPSSEAAGSMSAASDFQRSATDAPGPARFASYRGVLLVERPLTPPDTSSRAPASLNGNQAVVELVVGLDTVRRPFPLKLTPLDPYRTRVAVATPPAEAPHGWTVRGRNAPSGPFHFFWPPGTRMEITGERNGMARVRLADNRLAWVPIGDVRILPEGTPPPRGGIGGARMTPYAEFIDLRIPLPERIPFFVESADRTVRVSVFGATSQINFFQYGGVDPLIRRAHWSQPAKDVFRVDVHLTEPVWGYDTFYDGGGALVVRIRRPPRINPDRPLAGLLVAVDAGHPPAGAIGPTRLTEAEANLWIAQKLRPMLEAAGARVLMTRTDATPVELNSRPRMARDSNAHVLISIHNNAFPDGVNPFENNGTSVYYFQPHSADMALTFQRELLRELSLRDLGVGRADLALVRGTWMPSVLTETSFLMVPQQEAALRNPDVQERIARAHFRAVEAFLRQRAIER